MVSSDNAIRVLVADDEPQILRCYDRAFSVGAITGRQRALDLMSSELFCGARASESPVFELVSCSQGGQVLREAKNARAKGNPFDVIILDIRMPPGPDGVEVAKKIRTIDPDVPIVFVSGYADISEGELRLQIPRMRLYKKPLNFRKLATEVTHIFSKMHGKRSNA